MCYHSLARAGFAENENRGIGGGDLPEPEQYIPERVAVAHDFLETLYRLDLLAESDIFVLQLEFQPLDLFQTLPEFVLCLASLQGVHEQFPQEAQSGDGFIRAGSTVFGRTDADGILEGSQGRDRDIQTRPYSHFHKSPLVVGSSPGVANETTSRLPASFSKNHGTSDTGKGVLIGYGEIPLASAK